MCGYWCVIKNKSITFVRQKFMTMKTKGLYSIGLTAIVFVIIAVVALFLFYPINKGNETTYLYIDKDDNVDSIARKMSVECNCLGAATVMTLARHTDYAENILTGRYEIDKSVGSLLFFRKMRNGQQKPIMLTVKSVRTKEQLAENLSKKLMLDKEDLLAYMNNNDSCKKYGLDTATIITLFIPNTYGVYWNVSADKLLKRMYSEAEKFWSKDRLNKASSLGLSKEEVMTLASIVEEETANEAEKPRVAGMYYNRLRKPMPLQADPTIKFVLKDFAITRIYHNMLFVKSPYNTYMNEGLPPGPIRVPSVAGIDAVLNLEHHDYMYMCAKEDFSGTHNFAITYEEHLQNAARYSKALNERNIGKYGANKE